jgi:hypothetical protein
VRPWIVVWPVIGVTFGILWYRRAHPPRKVLRWVNNQIQDDDDE